MSHLQVEIKLFGNKNLIFMFFFWRFFSVSEKLCFWKVRDNRMSYENYVHSGLIFCTFFTLVKDNKRVESKMLKLTSKFLENEKMSKGWNKIYNHIAHD